MTRVVADTKGADSAFAAIASGLLLVSLWKMPRSTVLPHPGISLPRHFRSRLATTRSHAL